MRTGLTMLVILWALTLQQAPMPLPLPMPDQSCHMVIINGKACVICPNIIQC